MSAILTLEEAQARLKEVIAQLAPGEEVIITQHEQAVARLVGTRRERPPLPPPGLGKGTILYMAPDFDDTPEEFKEYIE